MTAPKLNFTLALNSADAQVSLDTFVQALKTLGKEGKAAGESTNSGFSAGARGVRSISDQLDTAKTALLAYVSVSKAMEAASWITQQAQDLKQLDARLKAVTGSAAEAATAQRLVFEAANRWGASVNETAGAFARLNPTVAQMGGTSATTAKMLDGLGASLRLSGATTAETSSVMLQFAQAMGSGRVGGDEFRSMMENAQPLMRAVAEQLHISTGELRQWAEEGKLTSSVFANAMMPAIDGMVNKAKDIPPTIGQAMATLRNNALRDFGEEFKGAGDAASEAVTKLAGSTKELATAAGTVADTLAAVGKAALLAAGMVGLGALIGSIGGATAALTGGAGLIAGLGGLSMALTAVHLSSSLVIGAVMTKIAGLSLASKGGLIGLALWGGWEIGSFLGNLDAVRGKLTDTLTPMFKLFDKVTGSGEKDGPVPTSLSKAAGQASQNADAGRRLSSAGEYSTLTKDLQWREKVVAEYNTKLDNLNRSYADKWAETKPADRPKLESDHQKALAAMMEARKAAIESSSDVKAATEANKRSVDSQLEHLKQVEALKAETVKQAQDVLKSQYAQGNVFESDYLQQSIMLDLQGLASKRGVLEQEIAVAKHKKDGKKDVLMYEGQLALLEEQMHTEAIKYGNAYGEMLAKQTDARNKIIEKNNTAANKALETQQKEVDQLIASNVTQAQHNETIGLTTKEMLKLTQARSDAAIAAAKLALIDAQNIDGNEAEVALLVRKIALLERQKTLTETGQLKDIAAKGSGLDGAPLDQFKELGTVMREAFATAGDGIVRMTDGMSALVKSGKNYAETMAAITALRNQGGESNLAAAAKFEQALIAKTERDQVNAYATMAGAAKGYFREGSTGYKLLGDTEKALRLYQLAMSAKVLATDVAAVWAKVGAVGAGKTAETGIIAASEAEQNLIKTPGVFMSFLSALGPWGMAAAGVAVAAVLGGAFSGGGGGGVDVAKRQAENGTGTVFGDPTAKSHSIEESINQLKDIAAPQLDLTSKMLSSLRSIDNGIGSLANLVVRTVGLTTGSNLGIQTGTQKYQGDPILNGLGLGFVNDMVTSLPVIGNLVKGLQGLWGKTSVSIEDAGIALQGSVGSLQRGSGVSQYADVKTTSSSWFGLSKSTSNSTVYGEVDAAFQKQVGLVFTHIGTTLGQVATALGKDGEAVSKAVSTYVLDLSKVSFKDLKGAELENAITDFFSAQADKIATSVMSGFEDFSQMGEGYLQTLTRVAGGLDQASYYADKLHISTAKLSEVQNKSGDVAAELLRTSIMDAETVKTKVSGTNAALYTSLVSGVAAANGSLLDQVKAGILSAGEPLDLYTSKLSNIGDLMSTFSGSASEVADYYTALKEAQSTMVNMGISADALNATLLRSAGGIDALNSGLGTYYDKFYTDAEKNADLTRTTAAKLASAGLKMPPVDENTRAWFRAQMDILGAQDLSIKKNADAYTSVLALAGSVDTLASEAEATAKAEQAWADKLAVMQGRKTQEQINLAADLASTTDEATKATIRQVYAQTASAKAATDGKAALDKAVTAQKTLIQATVDAAQQSVTAFSGLFNLLKTQVAELYNQVDSTAAMNAQAGRAFISQALATANSTGYLPEQSALADAISAARGGLSSASYKSQFEQDKATLVMASELAQLKDKAGTQLSTAEEQVRIAKKQLVDLDTTVKLMQDQIDASNGINASVLSVAEAIAALQEKLAPAQSTAASTSKPLSSSGGMSTASGSIAARVQDFSGVDKVLATADFGNNKVGAAYNLYVAARSENLSQQQLSDRYGFGLSDVQALFAGAGISAFADGGLHSGGWRLVGERGPEIEAVGPARYWDASTTQRMLSGAGQSGGYDAGAAAYIASLQEQLKAQTTAFLVMLDEHNRILRKWEGGGLPPTREVNA